MSRSDLVMTTVLAPLTPGRTYASSGARAKRTVLSALADLRLRTALSEVQNDSSVALLLRPDLAEVSEFQAASTGNLKRNI